jgi:peptidoglycan/xylan/chitin deacetylase (PgdA/CDA1 family)
MWNDVVIESMRRTSVESLDPGEALGLPIGRLALASAEQRRAAIDALIRGIKYLPQAQRDATVRSLARHARVDLPDDLMMSSEQVRELRRAGMVVGGHTVSHPILARLEPDRAGAEIADGKRALETLLDEPIDLFAYPNGKPQEDFRDEHAAMVRASGFAAAVTTGWGAADARSDLYRLPRFTPWDRSRWRFGLRLLGNLRRRIDSCQLAATPYRKS